MTIREAIEKRLCDHGLSEDEAKAVIDSIVGAEAHIKTIMTGRWNDAADSFSSQLMAICLPHVKQEAIKWIDKNKPEHPARLFLAHYNL